MANKFGLNVFLWSAEFAKPQYPLLSRIKAWGYDTVELPLLNPEGLDAPRIAGLLGEVGLDCSFCTVLPPKAHLGSGAAEARKAGRQFIRKCIETAAKIGGDTVAGPLYSPVGFMTGNPRTAAEWKRAVQCYKELAKVAEDHGVTIAVEPLNRFETYFLNTAGDARRFVEEVDSPRIGILFDTFHSNIEEKNVPEALRAAGPKVAHIHISENDRGVPGSGHTDWKGMRAAVREIGYRGRLVVETFGYALPGLSRAASIWRPLFADAETFAVQALSHLRAIFGTARPRQQT